MKISGTTKIVALLGYPVEHSLSPDMHNRAFERMGLDYCYVAFPVRPDLLRDAVAAIRALDLGGVNVTVPHKESVMPMLDLIDSEASFIGAVNTVVNRDGKLVGYNTDGRGFMRSLEEQNIDTGGQRVLIVGAGGAARAISYYLSEAARELLLYDIDREKAERLAADLSINRKNVAILPALEGLEDVDIIVNATPLGLSPDDPLPFDVSELRPDQIVGDLIYRPTRLQEEAAQSGCRTFDGLGMLLWQGVLASELWTGQLPPHDVMREALSEGLR
jgi:shikimate dehydrogenase